MIPPSSSFPIAATLDFSELSDSVVGVPSISSVGTQLSPWILLPIEHAFPPGAHSLLTALTVDLAVCHSLALYRWIPDRRSILIRPSHCPSHPHRQSPIVQVWGHSRPDRSYCSPISGQGPPRRSSDWDDAFWDAASSVAPLSSPWIPLSMEGSALIHGIGSIYGGVSRSTWASARTMGG